MTDRPRILVIDDEAGMRHAVERVLGSQYTLDVCETAAAAREAAAAHTPDLALLDVRLPDGDGFELMQELLQKHPDLDVVLMTASVHDMDRKLLRSLRDEAFFFLPKPFGRELLLTVVDRWRELKQLANRDREHTARLESERHEAKTFQLGLLPPACSEVEGVVFHGHFDPCEELSGDLYDYTRAADGAVAMLIADVSGHGIAAAMLSGFLKTAFQAAHSEHFEPAQVVSRIHRALVHSESDRFVTLLAARLHSRERRLEYVNAGHLDGLLQRADGTLDRLEPTGPLVTGAFPEITWEQREVALAPGDQLLLLTDGITEMRGESGLLGEGPVLDVLGSGRVGDELLKELLERVHSHADGRPADDDHTVLLARLR